MGDNDFKNTLVQLSSREKEIINRVVVERSYGGKGFSAALRTIVHEWEKMTANTKNATTSITVADAQAANDAG